MGLVDLDKQFVWHPFTQMKGALITPIVKGEGVYLIDEKGNKFIDAVSSWWVKIHGHSHPYIAEKLMQQYNELDHVIFAGITHPKAVELAVRLVDKLPSNIDKVFYSDNGSTANEIALKLALQYWHNQGVTKTTLVAFEGAYHGDTFGGMSVSARSMFSEPFNHHLFKTEFIPTPTNSNIESVEEKLRAILIKNDVAAFIYEPLVQGVRGMAMHNKLHLSRLLALAKEFGVLCIADEVMTGFGRTGTLFASDQVEVKPDIVTLSKALTAGVMPLAVTACSNAIYEAFYSDDKEKAFLHGHSFTGNALACAVACANLDLLESEEVSKNLSDLICWQTEFRELISSHKGIKAARQQGAILALELNSSQQSGYTNELGAKAYAYFLDRGIIMRPLGNVLIIMPPYCITKEELQCIYTNVDSFLEELFP
ncbi:MAG: adenosylmethionine--8-amino-7-oxononanoate transaminase [Crocinitomicaceae bacterium]|nr:adenosylmethionine--8-amino-7-oxononanoate transaminase [Crocinitomicaceae bacterium]MBT5403606.1 adenosylmethionine--8-amino-7-oxononanoate transaminase [Crocinitomicaceae bacterium]